MMCAYFTIIFLLLSGVYLLQYQTPYPNPFSPVSCFSLFPPEGADGGAEPVQQDRTKDRSNACVTLVIQHHAI